MKRTPKGNKEKGNPPYFFAKKTNDSIAELSQKTAFLEFV
ncbi:hypothetical protein VFMJ11_A0649 [Aliivibrio fischeri MJ11]|uniref:Uncharacterized protein n=1 Tax=Aliivibrio fischeri (strain MJ11) TaxID=388396 RepID=B5EU30_ALIFM|nr:hypothetical protein VFMJ11_A0649 [Aliivibrio fischeri MJ11]